MSFLRAFKPIGLDLLATIFFVSVYWLSGSIVLATLLGVAVGIVRYVYMRFRRQPIGPLQYVSIVLVVVSGVSTLLTNDPHFVQMKSSFISAAVGIIMLRTNWMAPYLPPIVTENVQPRIILWTSHGWGILLLGLAVTNAVVALWYPFNVWAWYSLFVPTSCQLLAFLLQFFSYRIIVRRKVRARLATQPAQ